VKLSKVPTEPLLALERTFFFVSSATREYHDGSTASVAYVTDKHAYVAVLGDSLVVARARGETYHQMPEHNVRSNPEEKAAAIRRGGFVQSGYLFAHDTGQGLQMARALGDATLDSVLSRKPDTAIYSLDAKGWVLLASDGLFDPSHKVSVSAASDGTLVQIIEGGIDAAGLVEDAIRRKTGDNVSAVLVRVGE
jgi:serine/threonine protein phosphatase PrpC